MEHGSGEGHNNSNFGASGGHMATPLACFDKVFSSVVRCGAPPSIWDPKHQSMCEVQREWFGDGGGGFDQPSTEFALALINGEVTRKLI